MKINIGTRRSELAQVQANTIMAMIKEKFDIDSKKVLIETKGDKILNVTLDKIGGKGLFVKEIEFAMLEQKADMAVHSMKDVPYDVPKEFEIVAIPVREDVRDAFVAFDNISFYDLHEGARIGTSSIRRGTQIKILRPDIEIVPIRGNVQTRIAKIEKENLDGIILAAAGLKRLGMENIITNYFSIDEIVPAIAQGALGIEMVKNHPQINMIKKLDFYDARICVDAERSFMATLNGDCHDCIGAYAYLDNDLMHMTGVYRVNGKIVKKQLSGDKNGYIKLGENLAKKILENK
ncbi:hydroxymethylbilane synthase [Clostridium estertheticum]|uniref:Porphobilinogen deaminase n=2 Tax=Clostridium estertheticum TaxID=238834 RepID=A0A1J0GKW4_9CLOT|nr:hydroxymethylbilane synthase [Clostridium estertheticum]APC42012.1 hydroxymethylbilane synthase [Clostridium estertheticum subsp. estertheticum]MBU3075904.1 hydroxymethylbilane synthase [Clostridium estertheticum]MBU3165866.1 hydroxymethylbilane synthase [Clostridium estertheticum]MBZ9616081.1 hydroxymethylbilane synthase [Clostridium estertheticum subsp. laramiense]MPQ33353.1 hydroxymethylbilane synthase [Clostridium estertheticum]